MAPGTGSIGSEYFTVMYSPGHGKMARTVHSAALKARNTVDERLSIAPEDAVMIILAPGGKEGFKAAQPGIVPIPEWAIGVAYPREKVIVISHPDEVDFRHKNLSKVITHEYVHVALGIYLGDNVPPKWLQEGLAAVVAKERTLTSSTTIGVAALGGRIIPFEQLDYQWPRSRNKADLAYAQSADFLSWIEVRFGPESFKIIIDNYRQDGDINRALEAATGKNLTTLEMEWQKMVRKKYIWVGVLTGSVSMWFIMSIIVIIGWARKKRRGKLKMEQWQLEDEMRGLWKADEEPEIEDDPGDDENHPPRAPVMH